MICWTVYVLDFLDFNEDLSRHFLPWTALPKKEPHEESFHCDFMKLVVLPLLMACYYNSAIFFLQIGGGSFILRSTRRLLLLLALGLERTAAILDAWFIWPVEDDIEEFRGLIVGHFRMSEEFGYVDSESGPTFENLTAVTELFERGKLVIAPELIEVGRVIAAGGAGQIHQVC